MSVSERFTPRLLSNEWELTNTDMMEMNRKGIGNVYGFSAVDLSAEQCRACDLAGMCCEVACEVQEYKANDVTIDSCSSCISEQCEMCSFSPDTESYYGPFINDLVVTIDELLEDKIIRKAEYKLMGRLKIYKVTNAVLNEKELAGYLPKTTLERIADYCMYKFNQIRNPKSGKKKVSIFLRQIKDMLFGDITANGYKVDFSVKKTGYGDYTKDQITVNKFIMDDEWLRNTISLFAIHKGLNYRWEEKYKIKKDTSYQTMRVKGNELLPKKDKPLMVRDTQHEYKVKRIPAGVQINPDLYSVADVDQLHLLVLKEKAIASLSSRSRLRDNTRKEKGGYIRLVELLARLKLGIAVLKHLA